MWESTVGVMVPLPCSILVASLAAEAPPAHRPRIGVLAMESGLVSTRERLQAVFREARGERGYVEGPNVLVDSRSVTPGQTERRNDVAVELVRLKVDLIVAVATPAGHRLCGAHNVVKALGHHALLHRRLGGLRAACGGRAAHHGEGTDAEERAQAPHRAHADHAGGTPNDLFFQDGTHARRGDWALH
jgi:hypothetical protein